VRAALHDLSLVEERDAWYGLGSLPGGELRLHPCIPPGDFPSKDLGRELGTDVTWTIREKLHSPWPSAGPR